MSKEQGALSVLSIQTGSANQHDLFFIISNIIWQTLINKPVIIDVRPSAITWPV